MRKFFFLALFVSIVLVTLGCISSPPEKKTETLATLRIGYQPTTHHVAAMVADDKGFWLDGLKPLGVTDIKMFAYPSAAPEIKAMQAGDLDVVYLCYIPLIAPISKGLGAKMVASVNMNGSSLVFRPGIDYSGPQSLQGLSIATLAPGTAQDILLRKWLLENDVNISHVKLLHMGPGDAVTAISNGTADGIFLPSPAEAIVQLTGKGKTVLPSGKMWPGGHLCCVVAVSDNLTKDHPEMVEQIVKIHKIATEYANADPEEAARIYSNHTGQDLEMINYSIKTWDGQWVDNPEADDLINSTLEMANFLHRMNYTQKELTKEDLFDTSFYDKIK